MYWYWFFEKNHWITIFRSIVKIIRDFCRKYHFYSSILILFSGIISNIFTSLRMLRENRSAYYLAIESMTGMGLLLMILPSDIAGYILGLNPIQPFIVWCKIQLMTSYSCGLHSLFTRSYTLSAKVATNNYNWVSSSSYIFQHKFHIISLIFAEVGSIWSSKDSNCFDKTGFYYYLQIDCHSYELW